MDSVGGPLSVLVVLLPGRGKEFLCQGFAEMSLSQGAGEKWKFLTDHEKCKQVGWVHVVPYSL